MEAPTKARPWICQFYIEGIGSKCGMLLVVSHSHNYGVLGNMIIGFRKHLISCKRWGMSKMGSTDKCPYVTTVGNEFLKLRTPVRN